MYNHQLDTFIVVADSGSFNKAAEALFISPPAVIKQINLLEDSLGVSLFTRTHRGLQLTKAGQSVYEDARYIIAYCRESVERAKKADDTQPSVLRIGILFEEPRQCSLPAELDLQKARDSLYGRSRGSTMPGV